MTSGIRARSAIDFALAHARDTDVIAGVKEAVHRELKDLDPLAEIDGTDYFNHSFVPDFVVKWNEFGRPASRPVYLRFTMRAASLGGDVSALADSGPIVLTLRENRDASTRENIRDEVSNADRVLVTDVAVLDEATTVEASRSSSPLLSLARSNIVRGARGLLEKETVGELVEASAEGDTPAEQSRNLQRFSELVQEVFQSDAATRLQRASNLIQLGVQADIDSLLRDADAQLIRGTLSDVELRLLIPYLLSTRAITRSPEYWRYVGSLMDLKRLEELASEFEGVDLTPLVSANLSTWYGTRASLVMQADELEGPPRATSEAASPAIEETTPQSGELEPMTTASPDAPRRRGWHMRSGMLSLNLESWRLQIASNGAKLRGRSDSASARWDDLIQALTEFELAQVTLLGVTRRVAVAAERDADVRADVETITESLSDSFFVPNAAVWEQGESGAVAVDVDFKKMLVHSRQKVTVSGLARIAIRLLGYRFPADAGEWARYLDRREPDGEQVDSEAE